MRQVKSWSSRSSGICCWRHERLILEHTIKATFVHRRHGGGATTARRRSPRPHPSRTPSGAQHRSGQQSLSPVPRGSCVLASRIMAPRAHARAPACGRALLEMRANTTTSLDSEIGAGRGVDSAGPRRASGPFRAVTVASITGTHSASALAVLRVNRIGGSSRCAARQSTVPLNKKKPHTVKKSRWWKRRIPGMRRPCGCRGQSAPGQRAARSMQPHGLEASARSPLAA